MNFFYSDVFNIPLPPKHRFPGDKYGMIRQALVKDGLVSNENLKESPLASDSDFLLVHDKDYVDSFVNGTIETKKMKRIGFPWSEFLVKRIRATIGGAVASSHSALETGLSGQLAGGTHHAHYDYGLGYCVFNDFAIVAKRLLREKIVDRVAVVDLDVHQGDGNATLLADDPSVFVFSMHGEKNFPFRKYESDLDIALPDGCQDDFYLKQLALGFDAVLDFKPDLILYQAGVDVLEHDRLGRLNISYEGLEKRDRLVFESACSRGIPVSMGIGGGYSDPIEHSVRGYYQTYQVAKKIYKF